MKKSDAEQNFQKKLRVSRDNKRRNDNADSHYDGGASAAGRGGGGTSRGGGRGQNFILITKNLGQISPLTPIQLGLKTDIFFLFIQ